MIRSKYLRPHYNKTIYICTGVLVVMAGVVALVGSGRVYPKLTGISAEIAMEHHPSPIQFNVTGLKNQDYESAEATGMVSSSPESTDVILFENTRLSQKDVQSLGRLQAFFADLSNRDNAPNISPQDLSKAHLDEEGTSDETRSAAAHLVLHAELFGQVDSDGGGTISAKEVAEFILPLKASELASTVLSSPDAQAAVEELTSNVNYMTSSAETKVAILSQASHFGTSRAINILNRLQSKQWFQNAPLGNQQMNLIAVGYMASDKNSHKELVDNTLDNLIGKDAKYAMDWKALGEGRTAAYVDQSTPNTIIMNSDQHAQPGNWTINEGQENLAGDLFTSTIAHEVNHLINNDSQNIKTGKDLFEAEMRAWRVGFEADKGRPPTNQEAGNRALSMLEGNGDIGEYSFLANLFNDQESLQSRESIIESLLVIWNRGRLTFEEIVGSNPNNPSGLSRDLGVINENDPNIIDNSSPNI